MNRKLHVHEQKNLKKDLEQKKSLKSKDIPKIKGRKIGVLDTKHSEEDVLVKKNSTFKEQFFTKKNIIYLLLIVVDIGLVIYVARKNIVNYVDIGEKNIFIGDKKNLWLGRNYISLIITVFFYIYTCVLHRYFLHEKNTKKFLIGLFFFLIILNGLLFYLFTVRVY